MVFQKGLVHQMCFVSSVVAVNKTKEINQNWLTLPVPVYVMFKTTHLTINTITHVHKSPEISFQDDTMIYSCYIIYKNKILINKLLQKM